MNNGYSAAWVAFTSAILLILSVGLGFVATQYRWPIANNLNEIRLSFIEVANALQRPKFVDGPAAPYDVRSHLPDRIQPGLMMIAGIDAERRAFVRVIDRDGAVLHEWLPDWFEMWPDPPAGIPDNRRPNRRPAALLHGAQIMPDGDLVTNWELLSTFRLSPCGDVRWQLPNLGHHSVNLGNDGTIFVSAETYQASWPTPYDNHLAPLNDYAIQQLDADGNTLLYKPILEILRENDLLGLMHQSAVLNTETAVALDTMHLNDVEVFPEGLQSTVFEPGDIMLSLRNISTILVVDPDDWRIKFRSTGQVLRQHDPDFAPGDRIVVYDNRNMDALVPEDRKFSRIVELDARTGDARVLFQGGAELPFYGPTLGRQQLLANGNILMIEGWKGHIMEVTPAGALAWDYYNIVDRAHTGTVTEAEILPPELDREFFEGLKAACTGAL